MGNLPLPLKKGYKFRIYPTDDQRVFLEKTFGSCRYVYNKALADAKETYRKFVEELEKGVVGRDSSPKISGYNFVLQATIYRNDPETPWLKDVSSCALQQSMLNLGKAYARFFREKNGFPNFKRKIGRQSFTLTDKYFHLKDEGLVLARLDSPVKICFHRKLPSKPSSVVISRTPSRKYYASFVCEYYPEKTNGIGTVGLDAGITALVTTSTGEKVENIRATKIYAARLRRAQQSLARKQKGSRNRYKSIIRIATLHERIANARNDHLHKLSRRLVNENQIIGMEALLVSNMVRNRHLAKHIQDASWRRLRTMLEYKVVESQHATLVLMDTFFPSSHLCSVTGKRLDRKLDLRERTWQCLHCGQLHDRDINAAINIANEAFAVVRQRSYGEIAGKIVRSNAYRA